MKQTTLAKIKKGDLFYTAKEYEKYGDNEKYLRIKDDYNPTTKKWHCPRFTVDAIGNGKSFKPDTPVVII
jgi:hypothetical protein